jgi:amidase
VTDIHELSALQLWQELQRSRLSPTEVVDHYLRRIDRLNPELGAFVRVDHEAARQRAARLDEVPRTAALWGLPFAEKDLWRRAGTHTGFGSRLMVDFVAETTDEIVQTLDTAGAVSLGATNVPEFGFPSYTESLVAPPARNPWNTTLGAGGSSGGAAVAVATGLLPFAPGSDGGGSVRIPAAACGLVGVKPSRGLVPGASGVASLAGLVVDGPLARTVADAALLLDGMIARTPRGTIDHHYALRAPDENDPFLGDAVRGEGRFQLAVTTSSAWDDLMEIALDPAARVALDEAVVALEELGHGIEELQIDPDPLYSPSFRTVWKAGASRLPVDDATEVLLEPLTRWLVDAGRAIGARELGEALENLSNYERNLIAKLGSYDAVLTPALALTPRPIGWHDAGDPERNFVQQCQYTPFTSMVNVSGLPAIVLPVHQTDGGLPMGVQLIGRPGGERTLFALGAQLERKFRWYSRHPASW